MSDKTSSAEPAKLYHYSNVCLQRDHQLAAESFKLREVLSRYERRCIEPGYRVNALHHADQLSVHAQRLFPTDYWVRLVGRSFDNADSYQLFCPDPQAFTRSINSSVSSTPPLQANFLPPNWSMKVKRKDNATEVTFQDENGDSIEMPAGISGFDVLAALRDWVETGNDLAEFPEVALKGKWQFVRESKNGRSSYFRSVAELKKTAGWLDKASIVVDGVILGIDAIALLDGNDPSYYVSTNLAQLPDGTLLTLDTLIPVDEDAQLVGDSANVFGSAAGGALGTAAAVKIIGTSSLAGPQAALATAGIVLLFSLAGGELSESVVGGIYDKYIDSDPPVNVPESHLTFSAETINIAGDINRIDVGRLVDDNGEVTLRMVDGNMEIYRDKWIDGSLHQYGVRYSNGGWQSFEKDTGLTLPIPHPAPTPAPSKSPLDLQMRLDVPDEIGPELPKPVPLSEVSGAADLSCAEYAQKRRPSLGSTPVTPHAWSYKELPGAFQVSDPGTDLTQSVGEGYALVWDKGAQGANATHGHVAIVEGVFADRVLISERNWGVDRTSVSLTEIIDHKLTFVP